MVKQMTLNGFVFHTQPQISQMLRYRNFDNINKAFTAALTEEKALSLNESSRQQTGYQHTSTANSVKSNQPVLLNKHEQCRYCKNLGHNINEFRTRQYNNFQKPTFK